MGKEQTPCGETEKDWSAYTRPDPSQKHYSEKGDHKERTIGNDKRPNGHRKHFRRNNG